MSQPNFYQVDGDDNGATYNVKLQDLISALTTSFSGDTAPTTTFAGMEWRDTSTSPPTKWVRDTSNTAWDKIGQFSNNTYYGSVTGSSGSTAKLNTARAISVSGDASGSTSFDGSANSNIALTLSGSGVTAGAYGGLNVIPRIVFDAKGRATGVTTYAVTYPITSFNGRGGAVVLQQADVAPFATLLPQFSLIATLGPFADEYTINIASTYGLGRYLISVASNGRYGGTAWATFGFIVVGGESNNIYSQSVSIENPAYQPAGFSPWNGNFTPVLSSVTITAEDMPTTSVKIWKQV